MKQLEPVDDDFKFLCKVRRIVIEKRDSDLVPYAIVETDFDVDDEPKDPVQQEFYLLETGQIPLPDFDFKLEVGDRVEFRADFYGHYYSYDTDCGREYDAQFEFRNVKELLVWRVIFEA